MAYIKRNGIWRPQFSPPLGAAIELDENHPARGMIGDGWLLNQVYAPSILGTSATLKLFGGAAPSVKIGPIGPYVQFTGVSGLESAYTHSSTVETSVLAVACRTGPQATSGVTEVSVVANSNDTSAGSGIEFDFGNGFAGAGAQDFIRGSYYTSTGGAGTTGYNAVAGYQGGVKQTGTNPFSSALADNQFVAALATFGVCTPTVPVCIGGFTDGHFYLNGGVALVVVFKQPVSDSIGELLTAEPFGLWKPKRARTIFALASANLTLGLSGESGSSGQGATPPSHALDAIGVSAAGHLVSLAASVSRTLSETTATGHAGLVSAEVAGSRSLTAVSATGNAHNLGVEKSSVALKTVSSSSDQGGALASVAMNLSGVSGSGQIRSLARQLNSHSLTSVSGTGHIGTISVPSQWRIDGSNSLIAGSGGSSFLITISTTKPNDVLILAAGTTGNPITSVTDTAGLTWAKRAQASPTASQYIQTWYAIAPSALTNNTVTATLSGSSTSTEAEIFAVSGVANTAAPFDTNASLPATAVGSAPSVSTTSTNTFVFGAFKTGGAAITPASGFTQIGPSGNWLMVEYQAETAAETSLSLGYSTTAAYVAGIGDALALSSAASGNVAVAGAEASASGAVHSLSVARSGGLSHLTAAASIGTLSPSGTDAVSTFRAYGSIGSVSVGAAVKSSEVAAVGHVGSVGVSKAENRTLTQVSAVGQVGTPTAPDSVTLNGVHAAAASGVAGSVIVGHAPHLPASAQIGAVSTSEAEHQALTGVQASGALRNLSIASAVSLSDAKGTAVSHGLGAKPSVGLTPIRASGSEGYLTALVAPSEKMVAITGVAGTADGGSPRAGSAVARIVQSPFVESSAHIVGASGSSFSISISTTKPNDVLVLVAAFGDQNNGIKSITDTAGLTWTQRETAHSAETLSIYYAVASDVLLNDNLTVTLFNATTSFTGTVFAVSGLNTSVISDPEAHQFPSGYYFSPPYIYTKYLSTFAFSVTLFNTTANPIPQNGFSQVDTGPNSYLLIEYQTENTQQDHLTFTTGSPTPDMQMAYADALVGAYQPPEIITGNFQTSNSVLLSGLRAAVAMAHLTVSPKFGTLTAEAVEGVLATERARSVPGVSAVSSQKSISITTSARLNAMDVAAHEGHLTAAEPLINVDAAAIAGALSLIRFAALAGVSAIVNTGTFLRPDENALTSEGAALTSGQIEPASGAGLSGAPSATFLRLVTSVPRIAIAGQHSIAATGAFGHDAAPSVSSASGQGRIGRLQISGSDAAALSGVEGIATTRRPGSDTERNLLQVLAAAQSRGGLAVDLPVLRGFTLPTALRPLTIDIGQPITGKTRTAFGGAVGSASVGSSAVGAGSPSVLTPNPGGLVISADVRGNLRNAQAVGLLGISAAGSTAGVRSARQFAAAHFAAGSAVGQFKPFGRPLTVLLHGQYGAALSYLGGIATSAVGTYAPGGGNAVQPTSVSRGTAGTLQFGVTTHLAGVAAASALGAIQRRNFSTLPILGRDGAGTLGAVGTNAVGVSAVSSGGSSARSGATAGGRTGAIVQSVLITLKSAVASVVPGRLGSILTGFGNPVTVRLRQKFWDAANLWGGVGTFAVSQSAVGGAAVTTPTGTAAVSTGGLRSGRAAHLSGAIGTAGAGRLVGKSSASRPVTGPINGLNSAGVATSAIGMSAIGGGSVGAGAITPRSGVLAGAGIHSLGQHRTVSLDGAVSTALAGQVSKPLAPQGKDVTLPLARHFWQGVNSWGAVASSAIGISAIAGAIGAVKSSVESATATAGLLKRGLSGALSQVAGLISLGAAVGKVGASRPVTGPVSRMNAGAIATSAIGTSAVAGGSVGTGAVTPRSGLLLGSTIHSVAPSVGVGLAGAAAGAAEGMVGNPMAPHGKNITAALQRDFWLEANTWGAVGTYAIGGGAISGTGGGVEKPTGDAPVLIGRLTFGLSFPLAGHAAMVGLGSLSPITVANPDVTVSIGGVIGRSAAGTVTPPLNTVIVLSKPPKIGRAVGALGQTHTVSHIIRAQSSLIEPRGMTVGPAGYAEPNFAVTIPQGQCSLVFDFGDLLGSITGISAVINLSCSVSPFSRVADLNAGSVFSQPFQIVASPGTGQAGQAVQQPIGPLVDGVTYVVQATIQSYAMAA